MAVVTVVSDGTGFGNSWLLVIAVTIPCAYAVSALVFVGSFSEASVL
jgi:hypothetical protein